MVIFMIGAAVLLLIASIVLLTKSRYQTIETARGAGAEELEVKRAYLKDYGVRCRVNADASAPVSGFAQTNQAHSGIHKLEVHRKDVNRAKNLLKQYEEERKAEQGVLLQL